MWVDIKVFSTCEQTQFRFELPSVVVKETPLSLSKLKRLKSWLNEVPFLACVALHIDATEYFRKWAAQAKEIDHPFCLPLMQIPETCQGRPFALHFVEVASEIYSLLLFIESSRLTTRKKGFRVKIPYLKYLWEAFDAARKVLEDRLEK